MWGKRGIPLIAAPLNQADLYPKLYPTGSKFRQNEATWRPNQAAQNHITGCMSTLLTSTSNQSLGWALTSAIAPCSAPFFAQSDPAGRIMSNTHPENDLAHFG